MDVEHLKKLYSVTLRIMTRNLEGITHEESIRQPFPGGNSINWILGHVVMVRYELIGDFGGQPQYPLSAFEHYQQGSKASERKGQAWQLEDLVRALQESQEPLLNIIQSACTHTDPEKREFAQWNIAFFSFHESYHTGQVGTLRRFVGKEGAIE